MFWQPLCNGLRKVIPRYLFVCNVRGPMVCAFSRFSRAPFLKEITQNPAFASSLSSMKKSFGVPERGVKLPGEGWGGQGEKRGKKDE